MPGKRRRRAWIRRLLRDADATSAERLDAPQSNTGATRAAPFTHSRRAACRQREIAGRAARTGGAPSTPGLFDRRAERSRQVQLAAVADVGTGRAPSGSRSSSGVGTLAVHGPHSSCWCSRRSLAMLPGLDGHLLSGAFIEGQLPPIDSADVERARGDLIAWRTRCAMLGPASTPRTLLQAAAPFFAALGFEPPGQVEAADSALAATLRSGGHTVALLVTPWGEALDPFWRIAVTQAARRSAAWCVLFDGLHLRIVNAGRLYARRHLEFDLDLALDNPQSVRRALADVGASALAAGPADARSLHALVAASDRHAAGVCRSLRDGVLAASADVLRADRRTGVTSRRRSQDSFEQALTIVYRMLFLLFAEGARLVPLWHPIYRESYSLEALRDVAEGSPRAPGLWDALRAIARLAHAGCRAGDLRVTPFNGRLFAPARTPLAERPIWTMTRRGGRCWRCRRDRRPDRAGRERIAYRDLGVEQLGAVYETLLDYEPRVERTTVTLETGSGMRKATGTFYTPQPIADYLVRRTLGPLVRDATPDRILQLRIVDPAMGSGAFLVAACRYLANAYEIALVRAGGCHASDIGEALSASPFGERSRSAASTASISTRWPSSSRGSRSGSRRSPPIGRSAFSITACRSATACSAHGSRTCGIRRPPSPPVTPDGRSCRCSETTR